MPSNALKLNDGNASIDVDDSSAVAPFRRNVDDEKESGPGPNPDEAIEQYLSDTETKSPTVRSGPGHVTRPSVSIEFPTIHEPKESFIHFPGSSSPDGADSPKPLRSRVSSFATDVGTTILEKSSA
jgi:1-phosphatidylinositol-3-phosphate 5-kinase